MTRRPRSWAREKLRRELKDFVRKNLKYYAALWAVLLTGIAFIATLPLWTKVAPAYASFFCGAMAMTLVVTVPALFFFADPSRLSRSNGIEAEAWTAEELGKCRHVMGTASNIVLNKHEIDSVAVTPGAVLAIEVKWHARFDGGQRQRDLHQAARSARHLSSLLRSKGFDGKGFPVIPVLVLWGTGSGDATDSPIERDGVHIVHGSDLKAWLGQFAAGPVPRDYGDRVVNQLKGFAREQALALAT